MSRRARRVAPALLLLGACAGRPADAPPRRVLDLSRPLPVRLVSEPPGLRVFAAGPGEVPGELLGLTPLVLDELEVTKEIWKHGREEPPTLAGAPARIERHGRPASVEPYPAGHKLGPELAWTVYVEVEPGDAPRRFDLRLEPEELDRAFARGRLDLLLPSGAGVP